MESADFMVLLCLLMACGFMVVFAQKRQELNGPCIVRSECNTVGYYCSKNRTCQCAPGYTPDENWKKCLGFVDSKCIYDSQCIEGAYCTGAVSRETCQCKEQEDYFPSEDSRYCISSGESLHQKYSSILGLVTIFWVSLYLNT